MFKPVHWVNEEAQNSDGKRENVTVVLWDYEAMQGRAIVHGRQPVDVYITDYTKADLTIGVKNSPHCTHDGDEPRK